MLRGSRLEVVQFDERVVTTDDKKPEWSWQLATIVLGAEVEL